MSYYLLILSALFSVFLSTLPLPSSASSLSMIFLSSFLFPLYHHLPICHPHLPFDSFMLHPCLSFIVLAGASIWSEGGDNR